MKEVSELLKATKEDPQYIENQFKEVHWHKNVLFINPQLNGRHFYKYILPYIVMWEFDAWGTAITDIDKYKPNKEYEHLEVPLNSREILWADYIVFPFTDMNLKESYEQLRMINPDIKIVFNVDFNYYLLSKKHPLHEQFSEEKSISNIEDNIFYSDITLVTNSELSKFLIRKFADELNDTKYKGQKSKVEIGIFPILLDELVIMENVPKKVEPLPKEKQGKLRVGIIATNYTWQDIDSYKTQFKEIKEKLGDKVEFVMLGFDGIDHKTDKSCFPKDFDFEHVPPCSIIHYYKQLKEMHIDMLFIPLRHNEYNMTSENYNKFLEAGLFKIPVMVYNIFPYNEIITNGQHGVLLDKKKQFVEKIEHFEKHRDELKRMGETAYNLVKDNFVYHQENLPMIDKIFTTNDE